jgi:hypothetical protein
MDASQALSQEEFVDDLALTSMARLWDVGKSEPIKGKVERVCVAEICKTCA